MQIPSPRLKQLLDVYRGLVEVGALLNGITDSAELMPALLEIARRVMQVEAASLFLVSPGGDLELVNASATDFSRTRATQIEEQKIVVPRGRGISGWVLEHGQPLLIADAYSDARFYPGVDQQTGFRSRSILCVPLVSNGREIGVLQVLNPVDRQAFDEHDMEALTAYATLAAAAIDKLRALERQRIEERQAQEFAFASEIQNSFLPQHLPQTEAIEFAAAYQPALCVGGDFYDVIELGNDEIYFVIGDVSGKGMPAALLMAQALSTLRVLLKPGMPPAQALVRWNAMLAGHTIRGMFITALLGRIRVASREVELCSAGHCHPFVVDAGGHATEVPIRGCPPIGLLPELSPTSEPLRLQPGQWWVGFSDGLPESFDTQHTPLGTEGISRLLKKKFSSARELIETLQAGERFHRKDAAAHDDATLLAFGFR
jgi:sigma-B regulation protein RsbU (phosphoserine phosphatase)